MTKNAADRMQGIIPQQALSVVINKTVESDEQISTRLRERFSILDTLVNGAIFGDMRSVIISGPPGLGKSFSVEKILQDFDPSQQNHTIIKGYVRATGLFKTLYQYRESNQTIVFDDADSIFFDDVCLNLLKSVCDSTENRRVSYLAETNMVDETTATKVPRSFDFNGTIIFITNLDFEEMVMKSHKLAPHLQALMSRSHYIDLAMKTKRDYFVRIKQVVDQGMLASKGLNGQEVEEVVSFVEDNINRLRELSLRMVIKISHLRKTDPVNWMRVTAVTCFKNS
jgi:hypothetical protein